MTSHLDTHVAAYQGQNLYDFDNEILLTWYSRRIVDICRGVGSMLELGLGHGFTTRIFAENFSKHVVLEGSPAVIENFRQKHPECKARIIETYFETFDTTERFDAIVMGFILEHVDDPMLILNRFRKFLAPGGQLFVAVPNAEVLNRRLGHVAGLLPDMQALSDNDVLLGHKRYYTVSSLSADIKRAGYAVSSIEGIYLKPFTTSQILSLKLDKKILDAMCEVGVAYPELSCGIMARVTV